MAKRGELSLWVVEALEILGGEGTVIDVAREIWRAHSADLEQAGDLFYTWQYDMRWAATRLRHAGRIASAEGRSGV